MNKRYIYQLIVFEMTEVETDTGIKREFSSF